MGRRSGFEGFLHTTARAVGAAERERRRGVSVGRYKEAA